MALPKLNAPEYELELPSNGQTIKYRPFLVKEQKILMIAHEGEDEKETVGALTEILSNCCLTENIKIDELPLFDIEYFFLQLRSKSVGEKVRLLFRHQECPKNDNKPAKNQTEIEVDLTKTKVIKNKNHNPKIKLTKDIGVLMKHPKINSINSTNGQSEMTTVFNMIGECIEQIYDADNTYSSSDYTPKELEEFLSDMTEEQFGKIQLFFDTMPKIKQDIKFKCTDCKYEDTVEVEGLQNFFT